MGMRILLQLLSTKEFRFISKHCSHHRSVRNRCSKIGSLFFWRVCASECERVSERMFEHMYVFSFMKQSNRKKRIKRIKQNKVLAVNGFSPLLWFIFYSSYLILEKKMFLCLKELHMNILVQSKVPLLLK